LPFLKKKKKKKKEKNIYIIFLYCLKDYEKIITKEIILIIFFKKIISQPFIYLVTIFRINGWLFLYCLKDYPFFVCFNGLKKIMCLSPPQATTLSASGITLLW
jgi:hypothetical protein